MKKQILAFIMVITFLPLNVLSVHAVEPDKELMQESLINEDIQEENISITDEDTLIGSQEENIPEEVLNDENTIIKYVYSENAEEGTILNQTTEDENTIIEIAAEETPIEEEKSFNLLNTFDLFSNTTDAPSIENNNWNDYPTSYEYNWDNSQNAWNGGEWRDGVCYKTEEGTYDNNVRHEMGMYTDGENIHLHISYATIYQSIANGDDFNFYIDGVGAKVRVLYADDGSGITGQSREAGTYDLVVVNGDHWNSGYEANGSYGTMVVKDGNINNELEIVVPLSVLKEQNNNINTDNIMNIEFFTPNLMYRSISCGGASSGPNGFIFITIAVFGAAFVIYKRNIFCQNN